MFSVNRNLKKKLILSSLFEQGFLLSWAITFKHIWERQMQVSFDVLKDTLASLLPEMQPRWVKGMATVISTHAIVSTPAKYSICVSLINTSDFLKEVLF